MLVVGVKEAAYIHPFTLERSKTVTPFLNVGLSNKGKAGWGRGGQW